MDVDDIKNMDEFASIVGISRPTISKYFNDADSVDQLQDLKLRKRSRNINIALIFMLLIKTVS